MVPAPALANVPTGVPDKLTVSPSNTPLTVPVPTTVTPSVPS